MSSLTYDADRGTVTTANWQCYSALREENSGNLRWPYTSSLVQGERLRRGAHRERRYFSSALLDTLASIAKVEDLPSDWGDGQIERPSVAAIKAAKEIAKQFDYYSLSPSRVSASVEGGIVLGFRFHGRYAGIEVSNSGEIIGLLSNYAGKIEAWDVDMNALKGTAERVSEHLNS